MKGAQYPLNALAIFLAAFAAYLYCAYPAIAPRDGCDLLKSALTLYPAHPPGYPLYALTGRLFSLIFPFGNFAYRLNILSAIWGAGAGALFYLWARLSIDDLAASLVSLAFIFSRSLWKFSLLPEMYSAQAFFLALLLYLSWGGSQNRPQRLMLSALVAGIGIVNHQSLIFSLPAFAYLWIKSPLPAENQSRVFRWAGIFFFLGLSLYLYMPIELKSVSIALNAILRAQYGTLELFSGLSRPLSPHLIFEQSLYFAKEMWVSSSPALILASLSSYWFFRKKDKNLADALLIGFLISGPGFLFLSRLEVSHWIAQSALEPLFMPATFFLCALAALGLSLISSKPLRVFLSLFMALWAFKAHFPRLSHRDDFSAEDYIEDLFRLLPPQSAVLARGDTAVFGLKYEEASDSSLSNRLIHSDVDLSPARWLFRAAQERPAFVLGISLPELASLKIPNDANSLFPCALIQKFRINPQDNISEKDCWSFIVLRPQAQLEYSHSYDHDIRKSLAFAHYQDSMLDAQKDPEMSDWNARWAAALDPEDYHLVLK